MAQPGRCGARQAEQLRARQSSRGSPAHLAGQRLLCLCGSISGSRSRRRAGSGAGHGPHQRRCRGLPLGPERSVLLRQLQADPAIKGGERLRLGSRCSGRLAARGEVGGLDALAGAPAAPRKGERGRAASQRGSLGYAKGGHCAEKQARPARSSRLESAAVWPHKGHKVGGSRAQRPQRAHRSMKSRTRLGVPHLRMNALRSAARAASTSSGTGAAGTAGAAAAAARLQPITGVSAA